MRKLWKIFVAIGTTLFDSFLLTKKMVFNNKKNIIKNHQSNNNLNIQTENFNYHLNIPNSQEKKGINTDLYIKTTYKNDHFLIEFYNVGDEDILDFKSVISWKQKNQESKRDLRFLMESEDPAWITPREINVLKEKQTVYGLHIPLYSEDGNVEVEVFGMGLKSQKSFYKKVVIKNTINPNI